MADVLGTDLLLLNRPGEKTYKINVSDLPGTGSAGIYVGPTPPYAPGDSDENNGDLWWDTTSGILYIYYVEADTSDSEFSKQWVQAAAAYGSNTVGALDDVNLANGVNDTQALVWDDSNSQWVPGKVGSAYVDLTQANGSNPFSLYRALIGKLPEIDESQMTDQSQANEWFLSAIADLEQRKLDVSAVGIHPQLSDVKVNGLTNFVGDGTQGNPIILSDNTVTDPGGYELSSDTITFENQSPGAFVVFHDENHRANGRRFDQDPGEIGDDGTFSVQLEYLDSPVTIEDAQYVGLLQVGGLYFKWQVDQSGVELEVTVDVVVEGTPFIYNTLHAIPAEASGGTALTTAFEWYSTVDGITLTDLGYSGSTYTIREEDENKNILVKEVITDTSGATIVSESNQVGPVAYDVISAKNPIIVGSSIIPSTLTVIEGPYGDSSSIVVSYQWQRDGIDIPGQTQLFYDLVDDDFEKSITVLEKLDDGHNPVENVSNAIIARYAKIVTNQCTVSGGNKPGSVLSVSGGDVVLGGSGTFTYSYKWYRDNLSTEIPGATSSVYTTTSDDNDKSVFCVKTVTDTITSETKDSTSTAINLSYDPLTATNPGILGRLEVGVTLSAIPGVKDGGSGSYNVAYSWLVNGAEAGTGNSYVVDQEAYDAGAIIVTEITEDGNVPGDIITRNSAPLYVDSSVHVLDDLNDVNVDGAQNGDILIKAGNGWTYADPVALPEVINFAGFIDVNVDSPPSSFTTDGVTYAAAIPGTAYIQHKVDGDGNIVSPTTFNDQWPDIPAGDEIKEGQYIVMGTEGKWHKGGASVGYVQSNFAETDSSSASFILNKPVNVSDFNIDIDYADVSAMPLNIQLLPDLPDPEPDTPDSP